MSKAIPFESLVVGTRLGPVETRATQKAMRNYCDDWSDPNPWYTADSPFGGPIAPPAFMAGLTGFGLLATRFDTRATIGTKTRHRNLGPLRVPGVLVTEGFIADKYVRRGLQYVVVESKSCDADGNPVRESRDHILLGLERVSAPDTAQASARWSDAEPSGSSPIRRVRGIALGEELPGTQKSIYQRSLAENEFSEDSIHNDDYTRKHGYAGALVSAYVLAGYMSEPLVAFFGANWFTAGEIALTFIGGGVQQGDSASCHARIARIMASGRGYAVELETWMRKADGSTPVLGTARGLLTK
jgi:acyl dehydratase